MRKIKLVILTLMLCLISFGQTKTYTEADIIEINTQVTDKIITALESNTIETVMHYFDDDIKNLKSKLKKSASDIKKLKNATQLSQLIVFDEDCHIFQSNYLDGEEAIFQIEFYFSDSSPESKVIKLKTKTERVLKKERKKRRSNTTILSPPPPKPDDG